MENRVADNEASHPVDVINAVSVTMAAEVNHWIETDEDDTQPALYWRQAYNCNTSQLSVSPSPPHTRHTRLTHRIIIISLLTSTVGSSSPPRKSADARCLHIPTSC